MLGAISNSVAYGDDFKVGYPTGLGKYMTLFEVVNEIAWQVREHFFPRDETGKRPLWRD
jgi:hypothetical protein